MCSSPQNPFRGKPGDDNLAAQENALDWDALEEVVHRDVGRRGLSGNRPLGVSLDRGELRGAARHLAAHATAVGIVTGFPIVMPDRVAAETDGPPGALFLAQVLHSFHIEVTIITDRVALPLLECGCELLKLDPDMITEFPCEDGAPGEPARTVNDAPHCVHTDRWVDEFLSRGRGRNLSHLVAIERPGPSHTLASLASQSRSAEPPLDRFLAEVPEADRDVCHDMHGTPLGGYTAKTHRLFEAVGRRKLPITTIGIGDGGNEIGMGKFAWEDLVAAIGGGVAGRIVSRIATDFALIAGISNWGAYALALATASLRGRVETSHWLTPPGQRELIETLVARAGAVDGCTQRAEATVDGLSLETYLQPLADIRSHLGL